MTDITEKQFTEALARTDGTSPEEILEEEGILVETDDNPLETIALQAVTELAELDAIDSELLKIKLQAANLLLNYTMAQEAKELEKAKIAALRDSTGYPVDVDDVSAIPFPSQGTPGFYPSSE